jgi:hypothetical protein
MAPNREDFCGILPIDFLCQWARSPNFGKNNFSFLYKMSIDKIAGPVV